MLGESHLGQNLTQMGTGVTLPIRAQKQQGPEHLAPRTAGMEGTRSGPWSLGSRNFWTWFSKVKQWGETGGQKSHLEKNKLKNAGPLLPYRYPAQHKLSGESSALAHMPVSSPLTSQPSYPSLEAQSTYVCVPPHCILSHHLGCRVFLDLSIAPEVFVKGSIQTIYGQYIATVYNICVCFHFSLLYVPHPI